MAYDPEQHFTAKPDGHGGVRLTVRTRFRDQLATELDEDGIARSREVATDQNGDNPTRNVLHVFGPVLPGESYEFEEYDNGTVGVVLISPPDEVLGNTTVSNSGVTGDRRAQYLAKSLGGEARKLATINATNKRYYQR